MKIVCSPQNPLSIVFEMRISMTLAEWADLRDHLEVAMLPPHDSAAGRLRGEIIGMVNKARQHWTREVTDANLERD